VSKIALLQEVSSDDLRNGLELGTLITSQSTSSFSTGELAVKMQYRRGVPYTFEMTNMYGDGVSLPLSFDVDVVGRTVLARRMEIPAGVRSFAALSVNELHRFALFVVGVYPDSFLTTRTSHLSRDSTSGSTSAVKGVSALAQRNDSDVRYVTVISNGVFGTNARRSVISRKQTCQECIVLAKRRLGTSKGDGCL
jgi:hypothetical protein